MKNINKMVDEVIAHGFGRDAFAEEGLDPYMVAKIIKNQTKNNGGIDYYELCNLLTDIPGNGVVSYDDIDFTLDLIENGDFGINCREGEYYFDGYGMVA